jgi:photosystem II stability/assembly factor-like uncharacterized protein
MSRKINYLLIIFSIYFCQINLFPQGRWESVESPTNQVLRSVHFTDSLYGWAAGDSGVVIHTTNSGKDWIIQNSNTSNKIVDIFFLNRNLGWASSWNSTNLPFGTVLLKTTDGGQNWITENYRDDNIFITTILFLDSLSSWMGGKPHALVKTTDGGTSWEQAEIDTSLFAFFPVLNITFYNSQYGYACGGSIDGAGVVWSTTNSGTTWFAINPLEAPPDPINEVHAFDSLNIIGVGGDREVYGVGVIRSSDGGAFWEYKDIGMLGVGLTLDFRTDKEAWSSLNAQQNFMFSSDSGTTWIQIPTPDSTTIIDVIFPDSLHGFAVGKEGAILKYVPPIVNSASEYNVVIPKTFELFQNYPNPFNPSTKIRYEIPDQSALGGRNDNNLVILKVYDVLGNKVATLINEEKSPGVYEVEFNADELVSGVYLYRLNVGEYRLTKKMILLR